MINQLTKQFNDPLFWKRMLLGFIILSLTYFQYSGMMLHHINDSPFQYKAADPLYWILESIGITALFLKHTTSLIFSILLFISFILALVFIHKRGYTLMAGIMLIGYQIIFNYKSGYHTHHLFGFHIALLPFYFRKETFSSALGLSRILACLLYFVSGFFKLLHGAWLLPGSFTEILRNQHAAYLYFYPDNFRSLSVKWIIAHPAVGFMFFISAMLLQLCFIAGLITNRFNKVFAVFIVLFHLMDWWLMNLAVFLCFISMAWLFIYKSLEQR